MFWYNEALALFFSLSTCADGGPHEPLARDHDPSARARGPEYDDPAQSLRNERVDLASLQIRDDLHRLFAASTTTNLDLLNNLGAVAGRTTNVTKQPCLLLVLLHRPCCFRLLDADMTWQIASMP